MTRNLFAETARRVRSTAARAALAVAAALLVLGGPLAHAQSPDVDPPGRVARLSDVSGQAWLYSPDSDEWITVARNRPLTTGDRLATDNDARADIALGTTVVRLDAGSELEVVQLDDARFVVHLHKGSAALRVRSAAAAAEFTLETDEGSFRLQSVGRYRFDRLEQASDVTVLAGQAVFEGRNSALPVTAGQHVQFWLDAGGAPQYTTLQPVRDAFAAWVDDRDRAEDRVAPVRFVSPEMTGADDLGRYGQWEETPEYGPIWTPRAVATGWAPYSTGRWAWVRPWGWTWVDDAPWGFAPFHYGRWVYHRNAWGWAPGTYAARPVYAPALVAWMGGPRLSVTVGVGGGQPVGWFPLAPREVYVPSYRSSPGYVRNINITNVTNVTRITTIVNNRNGEADRRDFVNRRFPNAVTVVPANVVTGRQPVGPSARQFRDDPRVHAFVSESRAGAANEAPPPPAAATGTRRGGGRIAARPPFEGRPPGGFGGRSDGGRPEVGRGEGGRPEGGRGEGGRPDRDRGREASPAAAVTLPGARPPIAGQEPVPIGRPPRGGVGREPAPATANEPEQRVAPPVPVRRGAPVAEGIGRPGMTIKEGQPQRDEAQPRVEPIQPIRPMAPPQAQPQTQPERQPQPQRQPQPERPPAQERQQPQERHQRQQQMRPAPDEQRVVPMQSVPAQPRPAAQPIQPAQRLEPRAAEPPRSPEAQRSPKADQGQGRPEPKAREERREGRDDKREQGDKQR